MLVARFWRLVGNDFVVVGIVCAVVSPDSVVPAGYRLAVVRELRLFHHEMGRRA